MDEPRRGGVRRQLRRLVDLRVIGWPLFWFSYAWFLAEALVFYLATDPRTALGAATVVVSATAGQLATFAVLLAAKYTYLRPRMARRHPSWMVLSFAVASLVGGITARAVQEALQPEVSSRFAPDLFNHTLYQTIAFCVVGIVTVALREHQDDVAELAKAQASLIATRAAGERALVAEREQVEQRVQQLATELTTTLPRVNAADASAALGYAAGDVIRPWSHELALSPPDSSSPTVPEVPYPSWLAALRSVASGPPLIKPAVMAATALVISASTTVAAPSPAAVPEGTEGVQVIVDLSGVFQALAQMGLVFLSVWFFARVAVWLLHRLRLDDGEDGGRAWLATILATIGIAVASQLVLTVLFSLAGFGMPVGALSTTVLMVIALLGVVAVVAVINTTAARRQAALADLATANEDLDWEVRRTNELLWRQRRELSTWLHGPVQASLNAGAIQLAQAGASSSEIDAAVRLFTEACDHPPAAEKPRDVQAELAAVRDTWAPLCEITWHLDEATAERIAADPASAATLADVIVEGCSNSVIHGGSTSIDIALDLEGDRGIRLVLANNGTPVDDESAGWGGRAGAAGGAGAVTTAAAEDSADEARGDDDGESAGGLGTHMLNDVCLEWARTSTPEGTVLEALFPLSEAPAAVGAGVTAAPATATPVTSATATPAAPATGQPAAPATATPAAPEQRR